MNTVFLPLISQDVSIEDTHKLNVVCRVPTFVAQKFTKTSDSNVQLYKTNASDKNQSEGLSRQEWDRLSTDKKTKNTEQNKKF